MLGQPVPSSEPTQRADRQGEREESQRPEPGLNLELLDGIGAEVVGERATREPEDGQEANEDQRDRREATAGRTRTLPRNRGCRQ